jgi:hypothetical protein
MPDEIKHKKGGQPGNQNARKHGFYSRVLDANQKRNLKYAADVSGLDEEINLLRVKLKSVVEHDPDNVRLISHAAVSLARLLRTRKTLGVDNGVSFQRAIENVNREIARTLGLDLHMFSQHKLRQCGIRLFVC